MGSVEGPWAGMDVAEEEEEWVVVVTGQSLCMASPALRVLHIWRVRELEERACM